MIEEITAMQGTFSNQAEEEKTIALLFVLMAETWCLSLVTAAYGEGGREGFYKPRMAILTMLNRKGRHRESERPFDVAIDCYAESFKADAVVFIDDYEQAEIIEYLGMSKDLWVYAETYVEDYWKALEDEQCTPELAPSGEAVPNDEPVVLISESNIDDTLVLSVLIG
jgi:hypothetical protein